MATCDNVPLASQITEFSADMAYVSTFVETTATTAVTPQGKTRRTLAGIDAAAQTVIDSLGFVRLEGQSFTTGATITSEKQLLLYPADGFHYYWTGALPKVVVAGSTPTSSGGTGAGSWLIQDDLEQRLGSHDSTVLVGGVMAAILAKSAVTFNPAVYGLMESNTGQQNTAALGAMSVAVTNYLNDNPSGCVYVEFPDGSFTIGNQIELADRWAPELNFQIQNFPNASIHVFFRNTKLKFRDGLRFGNVAGKNADIGFMLQFFRIGDVIITGSWELDGNDSGAIIGSLAARDYSAYGMEIQECRRILINGKGHHHDFLLDGIYTSSLFSDDSLTYINGLTSLSNGRQSHSIGGGKQVFIENFVYGNTGYGPVNTSPAAGCWIESEINSIGNVSLSNGYIQPCKGACLGAVNGIGFTISGQVKATNCEFENAGFSPLNTQHRNFLVEDCIIRGCVDFFGDPDSGITLTDVIRPRIKNSVFYDTLRSGSPSYRLSGGPSAGGGILVGFRSRFDIDNCKGFATVNATTYVAMNLVSCNVQGMDLYITGVADDITDRQIVRVLSVDYFNNFTLWNRLSGAQPGDAVGFIDFQSVARHENNRIDTSSGALANSIIWGAGLISSGGRAGPIFDKDAFNRRSKQFLSLYRTGTNISTGQAGAHRLLSYSAVPSDGTFFGRGDVVFNNSPIASAVPAWVCTTSGEAGSTAVFKPYANVGA